MVDVVTTNKNRIDNATNKKLNIIRIYSNEPISF